MAPIGGLSGSSSLSGTAGMRGYGGLASGLDRDTLIEQMTYGTRSKIAKQKQSKVLLEWEQDALRNITNKTYDFNYKYTSYSSPSNLTNTNMYSRSLITALGANSKYISVSGKANTSDMLSVLGIKQMAQDAKIMGGEASSKVMETGFIADDFNEIVETNLVENQIVGIKYGGTSYYVTLGSGDDFDYKDGLEDALNNSFKEVKLKGEDEKTLADVLKATVGTDGKITLENTDAEGGNSLEITSGSGKVLEHLGFLNEGQSIKDLGEDALVFGFGDSITTQNEADVIEETPITEYLKGKTLQFTYNGVKKDITIGEGLTSSDELQQDLQQKLDRAFGNGRVTVSLEGDGADKSKLVFKTTLPKDGSEDKSSILSISGGDTGLLGKEKGFFGINEDTANRLSLTDSLKDARIAGNADTSQEAKLIINGKEIKIEGKDSLWDCSVEEIVRAINEDEDAGVKIAYQSNSDRFVVTATDKGGSGSVELEGNVAEMLFGAGATGNVVTGQDAIIEVQYAGDDQPTTITRGTNAFTIDGLTLSLKGTFGYTEAGDYIEDTEAVTFDGKVDTEKTTEVMKEMIEQFNEILKLINDESSTKRNRNYQPLTDEQRAEMSEDQIEKWEEKAKEGILFNDSDVSGFADALRFVIPNADRATLSKMGITVSGDWEDNGKLVFNETTFKAALESDPDLVYETFNRERVVEKGPDGENVEVAAAGMLTKITSVMERYAGMTGSTKGILVERAGSIHAPTTVTQNSLQKEIDQVDKQIESLLEKLSTEQDRYVSQFTRLETLISQMNSQSGFLQQMGGGGGF